MSEHFLLCIFTCIIDILGTAASLLSAHLSFVRFSLECDSRWQVSLAFCYSLPTEVCATLHLMLWAGSPLLSFDAFFGSCFPLFSFPFFYFLFIALGLG
ncbi:hypothetical protein K458DRAFT_25366 [Lentithecium fluviatile CBS 122367]|uniref:Uncharacterized protein n=1 Tax=Lentithecium fluviatile CBS 122367 TaxID=1168545 RepID=A0A6G1J2C8_9PLEO|nr:hypothetical protein K458DRAFT_25366 [Lentithecium fluviatile CBS 122367]